MSQALGAFCFTLALLVTVSCAPSPAEPGVRISAPSPAGASATSAASREARVSGVSFQPLVKGTPRQFLGRCPAVLASSAGVYSITALDGDTGRFQLRLHGKQPFERFLEGIDWLSGATHPSRPELILSGLYTRGIAPTLLRPGAPARGVFIVALDANGTLIWQRVTPTDYPRLGPAALPQLDGSVVVTGLTEVSPLFGVSDESADAGPLFLSRLDRNGAVGVFEWYPERKELLSLASAGGSALYEVIRDHNDVLLRRRDERNRIVASIAIPYGSAGPLAADQQGGVWVFAHAREETFLPNAALFHYDPALTLLEQFEIAEIGRPPVQEYGTPPYVPPLPAPLALVVDSSERLWVLGRFRSQVSLLGRSVKARTDAAERYLAAIRHGTAEALVRLPDVESDLQPVAHGVVLTQETRFGECRVDSLTSLFSRSTEPPPGGRAASSP